MRAGQWIATTCRKIESHNDYWLDRKTRMWRQSSPNKSTHQRVRLRPAVHPLRLRSVFSSNEGQPLCAVFAWFFLLHWTCRDSKKRFTPSGRQGSSFPWRFSVRMLLHRLDRSRRCIWTSEFPPITSTCSRRGAANALCCGHGTYFTASVGPEHRNGLRHLLTVAGGDGKLRSHVRMVQEEAAAQGINDLRMHKIGIQRKAVRGQFSAIENCQANM